MPALSIFSIKGLPDWLRGLQAAMHAQQACVLITLVKAQGSVPREAGARMLVSEQGSIGTIGGGHLEWKAIQRAQILLEQYQAMSCLESFALGSQLDQCCGGVATLHYEFFPFANILWLDTLIQRWQQGLSTTLRAYPQSWPHNGRGRSWLKAPSIQASIELVEQAPDEFCLTECLNPPQFKVVLFGAGHVAQALVQILRLLACHIVWVDNRADLFPELASEQEASIDCWVTHPAAFAATQIPAQSFCLVMTHEHSLDLEICAHLLARSDLAYVGLIGSRTKAARFRKRLGEQGLSAEQIANLVCPMGISGIQTKQPTAIAISIAAQLLQLREQSMAAAGEQVHESS